MQKLVDKNIIEDIALKLKTNPSFVEKDLYAVKILKELSGFNQENAKLVFTGGTCLSKGYNLIKRFSEDLDFRIVTNSEFTRTQRKKFREFVINKIKTIPDVKYLEETLEKKNESKFFSFYVEYPKNFVVDKALRYDLRLEFTFENVILPTNTCQVKAMVSSYIEDIDGTEIECISPVEVAADKFSALMWRIDIRDRTQAEGSIKNDATIIRHLHDLAALEKLISKKDFKICLEKSFSNDKGRGGSDKALDIIEFAQKTLNKLKTDKLYEEDYNGFVEILSYAEDDEIIDFKNALKAFERIIDLLKN